MTDSAISFAVACESIRVFLGYPQEQFTEQQFFTQLGQTFMPGTPYMIQPLGLAAYLPGVLSLPPAGFPQEFALICYPSREVHHHAMAETLQGRVYNQTHGGVYAMPPSGAAFPTYIEQFTPTTTDPFFLFPTAIDWQAGVTHVAVAGKKVATQTGVDFRTALRAALLAARPTLIDTGIDQIIVAARDDFAVIWLHGASPDTTVSLDFLAEVISDPIVLKNERIVCVDEPPTLYITGSSAYNFIFLREAKYFLK